jgi:hypothetical protein
MDAYWENGLHMWEWHGIYGMNTVLSLNRVGYTSLGIIAGLEMEIRFSPHFRTTLP